MPQELIDSPGALPARSIVEIPLPRGQLILALRGDTAGWVEPTIKTLGRLLTLPAGWDSYGGRPIELPLVWAAWHLLTVVLRDESPAPAVVPTNRGGVQLEW